MYHVSRLSVSGLAIIMAVSCSGTNEPASPVALSGHITDGKDKPIGAAQIALLDSKLTKTADAMGAFSFTVKDLTDAGLIQSALTDTRIALRVEHTGYARAFRRVTIIPEREVVVRVSLPMAVPAQTITLPPAGKSVTVRQDFMELDITGGALVMADGTPATGDVEVWMQPYDLNNLGQFRPGDLRSDAPPDLPQGLKPKAVFNFNVGQNGELLTVANGQKLTLAVATTGDLESMGNERFFTIGEDSTTGLWHDEAPGVMDANGRWNVPVTHFSACCCFVPERTVHFHGRVSNARCEFVKGVELQVAPTTTAITVTPNPTPAGGTGAGVTTTVTTLEGAVESRTSDSLGEFHFSNMTADSGYGTVSITNDRQRTPAGVTGERLFTSKLGNDEQHPLDSGQTYAAQFQYCLELGSPCTSRGVDSICCGGCCADGYCRDVPTLAWGSTPACDPKVQKMCPFDEGMLEVH